jgi:hypothetical protein
VSRGEFAFFFEVLANRWGAVRTFTTNRLERQLMHRLILVMALVVIGLMAIPTVSAGAAGKSDTPICMIPNGGDMDNNGIGDVGVQVVCNYTSVYAYDYDGNYYWDLGDGRVQTSSPAITSADDLNQDTLTTCYYQVHTKGSFNNDPFQDTGEISNMINCRGVDNGSYHYQIVSQGDPRYTGNPDWAVWGTWEYHVDVEFNLGNVVAHSVHP